MKKVLFGLMFIGLMASVAVAAPQRIVLVDGDESGFGTSANPVKVSMSGTQSISGDLSVLDDVTVQGVFYIDSNGVDAILDEDAMGTDSDTALATQQSIKKYVDDNAGGGGAFTDGAPITSTTANRALQVDNDLTVGGIIFGGDVIVGNMTNLTLSANAGALNAGDNVDFKLNPHSAVGKTLPWNDTSNSVTVEAGTYELGVCMRMGFGADDGECAYWWYNVTASQGIFPYSDTGSLKLSNSRLHNVPTIITTVTVTETTELEVRIKAESNLTAIVAQKSWAYIRRVR